MQSELKSDSKATRDALLAAMSSDFAAPITVKQRCTVKFQTHEQFLDALAPLIEGGLVEPGLHSWSSQSGSRCSYRLSEAGIARKHRIVDFRSRNQELFVHA